LATLVRQGRVDKTELGKVGSRLVRVDNREIKTKAIEATLLNHSHSGRLTAVAVVDYLANLCRSILVVGILLASSLFIFPGKAYAISNPDSIPTVENVWAFRNVLETGDFLIILHENTPFAITPTDYTYSEAFIWRWLNGSTELAQSLGYDFFEDGYGDNIIAFYLDAADAPAWAGTYTLTLSGTPSAYASPPEYSYSIPSSSYSLLTDTTAVKAAIADRIISLANTLNTRWGLTTAQSLLQETETATVLSLQGQSFFRGAIYGLQGMAPAAFSLTIGDLVVTDRTWTTTYLTSLEAQHTGNYIETGFDAGEDFLGVDYNLAGILLVLGMGLFLVMLHWYIAGGNVWRGFVEMSAPLVISTRLGIFGLGELSLIAAVAWIYMQLKVWRLV